MKKKLLSLFAALAIAATVSAQVTYTCTAGTNFDGDEGIAKLFDNNVNTKYCGNTGNDVYALVTASEPVYVWGYEMTTANDNESYGRLLTQWVLYGTNNADVAANPDAEGWVVLSDLGSNNLVQKKNFYTQRFFCEKGVNKSYKYFKLVLNGGGFIQFSEFKFLGEVNRVVNYKWKDASQDASKKAVDLLLNQKWEGSNIAGNWMTIETNDGQPYAVKSYSFTTHDDGNSNCQNRAPKTWKLEGSNDNSTWTLIDEVDDNDAIENANYKTFEFTPSNTTDKFRYIKLTLVAMKGTGWTQVGEFHVLSISDISDAQFYTNLVDKAKATKAEYEATLGADDPWCQEYDAFFTGLDLDGVLAEAISSGEYDTLEEKLAEAENNAIGQAINLFVSGANYAAIAGSGDKCWGDGHYSQLFDGKDGCEGRPASKWGGNNFPQYVIFRVKEAFKPFFYKLVTGNDTANNTGRNWKTWNIYGGNFDTFSAAADSSSTGWTLIDAREDISEEYLPMKNFYPATFDFNKGVNEDYLYYMVEVLAPHNGNQQQMSEMYLCTQDEFEAMREPLVADLAEFAAGLEDLAVESSLEADKATFAELYEELQTTTDAVRRTKVYNDLVALKEKLEDSAAFVAGSFRVLDGNTGTATSGEGFAKLLDGNVNTKWCGTIPAATETEPAGSYVIFRTYAANAFNQYMLVTGNDTKNTGRNWKTWKIYGANVKGDMDELATRDLSSWTLIDEKTDIDQDRLPAENFAPAYFNFTNPKGYKYFKIELESCYSGTLQQMSEFKMLTDDDYAVIRQGYVDSLQNVALAMLAQYQDVSVPEALMNQITATATTKVLAVTAATADNLLPMFNDALNYITVEAPALVAASQLTEIDGVYQIANAYNLASFAALVNAGENDADAVVTADINLADVITNDAWTSIGTNDKPYTGTFDGQGFAITNITYTATGQYNGLFGKIADGAVVKNFDAYGTITVSSSVANRAVALIAVAGGENVLISNIFSSIIYNNQLAGAQVGGILGGALNGATTVDRCRYSATLDGNDAGKDGNYGGIVGYANNNQACFLTISNCLFDGTLVNTASTPGNSTFGGMIGYSNGANVTIKNALSIGTVTSPVSAQFFGAVKSTRSTIHNSYYQGDRVNGSASTVNLNPEDATLVTNEQLASGFVAARLAPAFRQNIGSDDYPDLNKAKPVVAEITEVGYATLYVAETDLTIPEGVKAFSGVVEGEKLMLTELEAIAAEEPVVLKGSAGYYMFAPTTGVEEAAANDLLGAAEDIEAEGKYILAKPEGEPVGFYQASTGTIKAGKAYLELTSGVKAYLFGGDGATGINAVEAQNENGAIYNVAGQRLSKMQKGINIVNGKKVLF